MNADSPGPRLAVFGYFGMGNLGNEGSLAAFLAFVRREHPEMRLLCIAADPEAVRREHGIPAVRIMAVRGASIGGGFDTLKKLVGRLLDVPRTFVLLRDVDVLVVPGTGVLERTPDVKPWGMPYWLFVAASVCRLRGGTVALVCVGADPPADRASRWLYRRTVSLAEHCSFRDEESRDAMAAMGWSHPRGEASHDLAFLLPAPASDGARRGHVVVGVMRYEGAPDDRDRGPGRVQHYVATMVAFIQRLTDSGREVVIIVGDEGDRPFAVEIARASTVDVPGAVTRAVRVSPAATLDDIMQEMAGADLVVASRFHHLVCALKMSRPTVSIGYAAKNRHLMARFGLEDYALMIEQVDLSELCRAARDVHSRRDELEPGMRQALAQVMDDLERHVRELPLRELSRSRS